MNEQEILNEIRRLRAFYKQQRLATARDLEATHIDCSSDVLGAVDAAVWLHRRLDLEHWGGGVRVLEHLEGVIGEAALLHAGRVHQGRSAMVSGDGPAAIGRRRYSASPVGTAYRHFACSGSIGQAFGADK